MNKVLHTIFILILTITINIGTLSFAKAASSSELIRLTNISRAENGLADLTENSQLTAAAFAKANDILANDYFAHNSPTGKTPWDFIKASGYTYNHAGENLAIGYDDDTELHQAWMDSATHRANILHSDFREIGIAVVSGEYEGAQTTVVVQMFGTPVEKPVTVAPAAQVQSTPQVQNSAQIQSDQTSTQTVPIATEETIANFSLVQEKCGFSPSQVFVGETVKFSIVTNGEADSLSINYGTEKINLLESGTLSQDGETKTYSKDVKVNSVGEWLVTLTAVGKNGQTETMNLGSLKIAEKSIIKEKEKNESMIMSILSNKLILIGFLVIIVFGIAGLATYKHWPKRSFVNFSN